MDFEKILAIANTNQVEAKYEFYKRKKLGHMKQHHVRGQNVYNCLIAQQMTGPVSCGIGKKPVGHRELKDLQTLKADLKVSKKQYSTEFAPPKKALKTNVRTQQIRQFLEKKEQEERNRIVAEKKRREELLALRAQNTKNNKKAKIMASRTKDNDFSRIRMTEDEIEAKQKREREFQALALKDKRDRMKARIELVEKEKQLPRKRKRKSKLPAEASTESQTINVPNDDHDDFVPSKIERGHTKEQNNVRKRPPPPSGGLNFHDLLKVAAEKQHEPLKIRKVEKKDDRPLSKKEKRFQEEAENRARRKMAASKGGSLSSSTSNSGSKSSESGKLSSCNFNRKTNSHDEPSKTKPSKNDQSSGRNNPTVIQLQKADDMPSSKQKTMQKSANATSHFKQNSQKPSNSSVDRSQTSTNNLQHKTSATNGFKNDRPSSQKKESSTSRGIPQKNSKSEPETRTKPSKSKSSAAVPNVSVPPNPSSLISDDMMTQIANQIREKLQKEFEEKFLKQQSDSKPQDVPSETKKSKSEPNRTDVSATKKSVVNAKPTSSKVLMPPPSRDVMPQKKPISSVNKNALPPKKAPSKAFHLNPYLLPPRRLLESQRPSKPVSRRIESDSEDEDDDDMDDFIDNSSSNQEDYSKYIREIFNYDKSRYADDDGDIEEASFAQVCQEEVRSAKIGYLEDLEDIRMEKEGLMRKKMKKKNKK